jgi:hypothetical protein
VWVCGVLSRELIHRLGNPCFRVHFTRQLRPEKGSCSIVKPRGVKHNRAMTCLNDLAFLIGVAAYGPISDGRQTIGAYTVQRRPVLRVYGCLILHPPFIRSTLNLSRFEYFDDCSPTPRIDDSSSILMARSEFNISYMDKPTDNVLPFELTTCRPIYCILTSAYQTHRISVFFPVPYRRGPRSQRI